MSFCEHCVVAVRHEGTATGTMEQIGGIDTYVARPDKTDYAKDKAIIIITDVFGIGLINNKLLADGFAQNGFQVFTPDLFDGKYYTDELAATPGFSLFDDWLPKHTFDITHPKLDTVISGLRERGITSFAIIGYCYGARSTFDYAQAQLEGLKAIAVAHPTFLQVPEDLQKLLEVGKVSLLIHSCEFDPRYPIESQKIGDELLGDGKYKPGYKRTYWPGCTHGFAVRGDLSKPEVKAGKEGAFKATVEWFAQHL